MNCLLYVLGGILLVVFCVLVLAIFGWANDMDIEARDLHCKRFNKEETE